MELDWTNPVKGRKNFVIVPVICETNILHKNKRPMTWFSDQMLGLICDSERSIFWKLFRERLCAYRLPVCETEHNFSPAASAIFRFIEQSTVTSAHKVPIPAILNTHQMLAKLECWKLKGKLGVTLPFTSSDYCKVTTVAKITGQVAFPANWKWKGDFP